MLLACMRWDELLHEVLLFACLLAWVTSCLRLEFFCHWLGKSPARVSASSPIGHLRHPRACVALMYCRTVTSWDTHCEKQVDRKNFVRMITFGFGGIPNYFRVAAHDAFATHGWRRSDEWIFRTKRSRFNCSVSCGICVVFDMVDAVSADGACALGWNIVLITPL